MKRLFLLTIALMTTIFTCDAAMTKSRVRKEARFLTDKMAYELNLSNAQYNDVYEINYDFIHEVNYIMDDVLDGFAWALDDYYYLLDMRNDDLRWVLSAGQSIASCVYAITVEPSGRIRASSVLVQSKTGIKL